MGVASSDQSVSVEILCGRSRTRLAQDSPMVTQRWPLIVQQEKLLKLAVSDYSDRIVDGRGLRKRVITQPRP
jgi:hypothetical protein